MFCKKCGNKQKSGERFCSRCGNPFDTYENHAAEKDVEGNADAVSKEDEGNAEIVVSDDVSQAVPSVDSVQSSNKENVEAEQSCKEDASKAKGNNGCGCIVILLIAVISIFLMFKACSSCEGGDYKDVPNSETSESEDMDEILEWLEGDWYRSSKFGEVHLHISGRRYRITYGNDEPMEGVFIKYNKNTKEICSHDHEGDVYFDTCFLIDEVSHRISDDPRDNGGAWLYKR